MVEKLLVEELHIGISAESASFNAWPAGKNDAGNLRMVRQTLAFGRVGTGYRIHVVDESGIVDSRWCAGERTAQQANNSLACVRTRDQTQSDRETARLARPDHLRDRAIGATATESASKIGEMIGETKVRRRGPNWRPSSWDARVVEKKDD